MVDNSLIKALIAGDLLNVRQIRSEPFEMLPTVKLWWSMNDLPEIADASEGFLAACYDYSIQSSIRAK